jgi:hypothetical protein
MGYIRKFGCPLMIGAAAMLMSAVPATAEDGATAPPAPVPHLSSPDHLPPGAVAEPTQGTGRVDYLRDLWHAVQTQEISGGNALLLLTQLPMEAPTPPGLDGPQLPAPAPEPDTPAAAPVP